MKVDIEAYGFNLDSELSHFVKCCAAFELGPQRRKIESVQIQLTHLQKPRHRRNRYCLVQVRLTDGHRVLTRDSDLDLHVAIYRALERAGWISAQRQLQTKPDIDSPPVPRQEAPDPGEPNWAA